MLNRFYQLIFYYWWKKCLFSTLYESQSLCWAIIEFIVMAEAVRRRVVLWLCFCERLVRLSALLCHFLAMFTMHIYLVSKLTKSLLLWLVVNIRTFEVMPLPGPGQGQGRAGPGPAQGQPRAGGVIFFGIHARLIIGQVRDNFRSIFNYLF